MSKKVSPKNMLKNGGLFIGLILLTFYIIFKNNNIEEIINAISSLNINYTIIGIVCSCTFIICEGINIGRNLKLMEYEIKFFTSIKYAIVGLFFSSVTPSASGGQPMQVYYMHKDGIQVSHSSLALLMDLASFQFVTVTMAIVGYIAEHKLLVNTLGKYKIFSFTRNYFKYISYGTYINSNFFKKIYRKVYRFYLFYFRKD